MSPSNEYNVLVIYDIVEDKRRNKMSKLLKGYGLRIQKSAFECILTRDQFSHLSKKISKIVDEKDDVVKAYIFNKSTESQVWGEMKEYAEDEVVIL